MFKVKLEMDGLERWLTSLHYEYFCPVSINENKYRQFLKKNFPYEPSDAYIYQSNKHLPFIKHSLLDEKIESECRKNLDRAMQTYKLESTLDSMIDPFEINDQKNAYYCTLAKTRHNAGLDRYLVPNFTHNYDKYIRPSENISAPITYNRIGGVFSLVFNSSESDEVFYEWMLSDVMKSGQFVFYDGDMDQAFKIEFWDCFCISLAEQMIANSSVPMRMYMRISPAITRNRGVEDQKSWKITDITPKSLAFGPGPDSAVVEDAHVESFDAIYLLNKKGEKIKEIDKEQSITLVIKTKGKIGKLIKTLNMNNEEYDFIYNGALLKDDKLHNYTITKDEERIQLEVIKQQE